MQTLLLLSALASLLFLTIYGAGIYAWTLAACAIPLTAAGLIFLIRKQKQHSGIQADSRPSKPAPKTKSNSTADARKLRLPGVPALHLAILLFLLLTLLPLPLPITRITGNLRYRQNKSVTELVDQAAQSGIIKKQPVPLFSTSRNRAGTLRMLLFAATVFSAFTAVSLLSRPKRRIFLVTVILLGIATAVLGYISYAVFPEGNRLWWIFTVPPFHRPPVGSFLNLNHYAGFIALIAVAAAGLAAESLFGGKPWRALPSAIAALIIAAFVIVSASRGATLALGAGLAFLGIYAVARLHGPLRLAAIGTCLLVAIAAGALVLHSPKAHRRLATLRHPLTDYSVRPRLSAWQGAFKVWQHYPVIGTGANAFRFTYPQYKDKQFRAFRRFAENEPLHILAEGGLFGLVLIMLLLAAVVSMRPLPAAVLVTALAHTSVDFIFHLPLYAITLAMLLAAGKPANEKDSPRFQIAALAATLALCLGLLPLMQPLSNYDAAGYVVSVRPDKLARLLSWSPTNAAIYRRLAADCIAANQPASLATAEKLLEKAVDYDPTDFNIRIALGKLRLQRGDRQGAIEAFNAAKAIRSWAPVPKIPPAAASPVNRQNTLLPGDGK